VGEVGLDRRAGKLQDQIRVLRAVFSAISGEPVLVSVHSAGCTAEIVELVREMPHPGIILHWFLGSAEVVRRAVAAGCYFSVNGAMSDEALRQIPLDRMLPETDFPSTVRSGGGSRPADTAHLEHRLAELLSQPVERLRWSWYRNLRAVALASGALERLPATLADQLLAT
jgi:TatD DNase family protein